MATDKPPRIDLAKEYISPAIFLLNKYVKEKTAILKSIPDLPALSHQKATTEELVNQFTMAVRTLESDIKPLDKKIRDSLLILRQQRFIQQCKQPPQMTPLGVPPAQSNNVQPTAPLTLPNVNGIPATNCNGTAAIRPNYSEHQENDLTCPFCSREAYNTRAPLQKHIQDDHPEHIKTYEKIAALTPEFMLNSKTRLPGNNQCFYCKEFFRSNAPLFRHIQEKHVYYFDIFVRVSLIKGNKSPLKSAPLIRFALPPTHAHLPGRPSTSNDTPRPAPFDSVVPQASIACHSPPNVLITPALNHPPVNIIESRINGVPGPAKTVYTTPSLPRVNQANESGAISTPQNARKSIKSSSINRFSIGVASASPVANLNTNTIINNNKNNKKSKNNNVTPPSVHAAGPSTSKLVVSPGTKCHQSSSLASRCEIIIKPSPTATVAISTPPSETQVASERPHSARKRRQIISTPSPVQQASAKKKNRRSRYLDDSFFNCSRCGESLPSANALALHSPHCCSKGPQELIAATTQEQRSPPLTDANGVMQSHVVSSSVVSSSSHDSPNEMMSEDAISEDDEGQLETQLTNPKEISAQLKRKLIRTLREVEVILPTIHQEDLVAFMRSPSFRNFL